MPPACFPHRLPRKRCQGRTAPQGNLDTSTGHAINPRPGQESYPPKQFLLKARKPFRLVPANRWVPKTLSASIHADHGSDTPVTWWSDSMHHYLVGYQRAGGPQFRLLTRCETHLRKFTKNQIPLDSGLSPPNPAYFDMEIIASTH